MTNAARSGVAIFLERMRQRDFDSGTSSAAFPTAPSGSPWALLLCLLPGCVTETSARPPEGAQASAALTSPATPPIEEVPSAAAETPAPDPGDTAPGTPATESPPETPPEAPPEARAELARESGETTALDAAPPTGVATGVATAEQESLQPAPAESAPVAPVPPPAPIPRLVSGSFALRYRGRFTDDDQDHEARGLLTLDILDPRASWVRGHLMARADLDLDGLDEGLVFQDLSDTYDGSLITKLYLAYAELDLGLGQQDSPGTLRVGRQSDVRLPEVLRLDGVSFLSRPMGAERVEIGLYGGVPVHLYESSPEGDRAYGTFVEAQPWDGGRARVDWMHLEDELVLGDEKDDLFGLGVWHDLSRRVRLEGELTRLESEARDVRVRALYQDPESETLARIGYYELQETQRVRVTELDPFYESLLEYYPYRQVTLNVSRALGTHTLLDLGYDVRRLSDADDVGEFNREWERYYATATLHDAPLEGFALSLTGDLWDDDEQETSSLGADVSLDRGAWRTSLGSYYSLYKYELLELSEREDVRTYYARALRELSEYLRLDLGYELENDDFDTYHTVRLGVSWRF